MCCFVYILYSERLRKYYIGRTENLELRLQFHNDPIESRKFTARGIPWVLKVFLPCDSKAVAIRLEAFIKKRRFQVTRQLK